MNYSKKRFKDVDKAIKSCLMDYFGGSGCMEVAEDTWNVYYPNSRWKATDTVWIYKTKVKDAERRTFAFSCEVQKSKYAPTGLLYFYKAKL